MFVNLCIQVALAEKSMCCVLYAVQCNDFMYSIEYFLSK